MSLSALQRTITDLPYALSEQVLNYARAVEAALPEIFADAGVKFRVDVANSVVFVAGLRKLLAIVDSNYWMVDNTGAIFEKQNVSQARVGGTEVSRSSKYYFTLHKLRRDLFAVLEQQGVLEHVSSKPYSQLVRDLVDGR